MTYQTYRRTLIYIGTLYIPIFLLAIFMEYLNRSLLVSIVSALSYYAYHILTLYFLFFSIYANISGVKDARKIENPIFFIIFGTFLVILLFGPPIAGYFSMLDIKNEALDVIQQTEIKEKSMNVNIAPGERYLLAREFFIETGEFITYLDQDNKVTIFAPAESTLTQRRKHVQYKKQMELLESDIKPSALSLMAILGISLGSFLGFLWYQKKGSI